MSDFIVYSILAAVFSLCACALIFIYFGKPTVKNILWASWWCFVCLMAWMTVGVCVGRMTTWVIAITS